MNDFVAIRLSETWRTVENSSLTNTSPESETDVEYEDDEIDHSMSSEDFEYHSDQESIIYDLPAEAHDSFHCMRIVDWICGLDDETRVESEKFERKVKDFKILQVR